MLLHSFSKTYIKGLVGIYLLVIAWWLFIFIQGIQETSANYAFSLFYSFLPLGWGVVGFLNGLRWGGLRSVVGRAVLSLSIGIFAWGIGNLIFAYYNLVLHIPVPYPSIADASFILIYPFSILGMTYLFRAVGASLALRSMYGKLMFLLIPIFAAIISYYLLFIIARGGEIVYEGDLLKLFLDISYPTGSALVAMLATIVYGLSFKFLGGFFRMPIILILLGFISNYFADFLFSYTTTTGTYFVGMWVDLFYPTAFLLISLGLTLLDPRLVSKQ